MSRAHTAGSRPSSTSRALARDRLGVPAAAVLRAAGVSQSCYFTISIDHVLRQMAARGIIPLVEGLTPMDAADLVHTEAQYLAKRAGLRAMADGRNHIWDISMATRQATQALLDTLRLARYRTEGLSADLTIEESVRRTNAAQRRGHDEYLAGRGLGGRYIPPEAIRALLAAITDARLSELLDGQDGASLVAEGGLPLRMALRPRWP
jgi:Zeta toxin